RAGARPAARPGDRALRPARARGVRGPATRRGAPGLVADVGGMRGAVSRKGWVLFAVMCLVWGIPYLFIKVAVGEVSVPVVVFARTAIGALLLLPLALRASRNSGGQ